MPMKELIALLHKGGYSCVIAQEGSVKTFTGRGIADLYEVYTHQPEMLRGSCVADKVVGRGAAALLIAGGTRAVYADVISHSALELLQTHRVEVSYTTLTEGIINRKGDGPCPVEQRCQPLHAIPKMIAAIQDFMASLHAH